MEAVLLVNSDRIEMFLKRCVQIIPNFTFFFYRSICHLELGAFGAKW